MTQEIKEYCDKLYEIPDSERLFPIVGEAVQHKLVRHIQKAEVKKIRVHDLRHSACAYLAHQGVAPMIIKERMGHKDIKITLNTYGHLYPNEQKKVADILNRKGMRHQMRMPLLVTGTFQAQIELLAQFSLQHKKDKPSYINLANLL